MCKNKKMLCAFFLSGLCCLGVLSGCASGEKGNPKEQETEEIQTDADAGDQASQDADFSQDEGEDSDAELLFSMEDIEGETYTQEMFADYNLTMINVFTTWCTPCINEIPDLEILRNDMADQGVNIVGIVLDAMDGLGDVDETAVEKAKILAEQTGVTYPFLIPDENSLNGRLSGIQAVPETFFVDKDGNIVGETYSGSRSYEEWKNIVEEILEGEVQ